MALEVGINASIPTRGLTTDHGSGLGHGPPDGGKKGLGFDGLPFRASDHDLTAKARKAMNPGMGKPRLHELAILPEEDNNP